MHSVLNCVDMAVASIGSVSWQARLSRTLQKITPLVSPPSAASEATTVRVQSGVETKTAPSVLLGGGMLMVVARELLMNDARNVPRTVKQSLQTAMLARPVQMGRRQRLTIRAAYLAWARIFPR
jgi:hypothetical protein